MIENMVTNCGIVIKHNGNWPNLIRDVDIPVLCEYLTGAHNPCSGFKEFVNDSTP